MGRVNEIFNDAIERPLEQRKAYIHGACGSDEALREQVAQLVELYEHGSHSFMNDPTVVGGDGVCVTHRAPSPSIAVAPRLERSGSQIGAYHLLERIGEGGFGTVFMAEQEQPVRRRVALKVIKLGMDTRQVIARFEAERQALALMDHPNIARVLDAGATDAQSPLGPGRPFFVMELVKGTPITRFCDEHRLAPRDRLALFCDVCHAVQHAHQKGVIHRDLKPSNVLVSRYDDKPVVKIIDFGIAKAIGGRLTDKTLFTEMRQMIGTPAYMSPEQAGLSDLDVDTRSDTYSLGVLLYELLTGTTPLDAERLRSADFDELRRIIREEEPPKPSTRVSRLSEPLTPVRNQSDPQTRARGQSEPQARARGIAPMGITSPEGADRLSESPRAGAWGSDSSAAALASERNTDPRTLTRLLRGDLDWIVMKCLDKDRTRRYETTSALAADVQRHLAGEPVVAAPPSRLYRLSKTLRRHRAAATVAAAFVLLVTSAAVVFAVMYQNQSRERARAEEHKKLAETAQGREREQRELADEQRDLAEKREKQTQQVSEFQAAMLSEIDVEAMGHGIKERFRDQVRAALERQYVGESPNRRKRTPEEIEAELAAFDQRADAAQAVDVARGVMDQFVLARAADALEKQFADQPLVQAQLHFAIGRTYADLGLFDAAEPHLQTALQIRLRHYGREHVHPEVADCLYNLAGLKSNLGSHAEAETLYREALAMWRELSDKELVARTLEALGNAIQNQGQSRLSEAEVLFNEALRLNRKRVGDDHPEVVGNRASLAVLLKKQGRLPEAEALNRQVLQWRRAHFGDQHPKVAHVLSNLAQVVADQGRGAEAEELFREALAIHRTVYGDEHPRVAKHLFNLGVRLVEFGRRAEGENCLRQALAQQRKLLGDQHPDVRQSLTFLANVRKQEGDYDEAVSLLREALAITERAYPDGNPEAWRRFSVMNGLGGTLSDQARMLVETDRQRALALFQEAEPLIVTVLNKLKDEPNMSDNAGRRRALDAYSRIFEFWHTVAPDKGWGDRAAEWRAELEKTPGP